MSNIEDGLKAADTILELIGLAIDQYRSLKSGKISADEVLQKIKTLSDGFATNDANAEKELDEKFPSKL